jgi:TonB family protein
MKEVKRGDEARFAALSRDVALPGHQEWLVSVFGNELGQELALSYANLRAEIQNTLFAGLRKMQEDGFRDLRVTRQLSPCLAGTPEQMFRILAARKVKIPFYSVNFRRGEATRSAGFFVFLDGAFRWIGNLRFGDTDDPPVVPPPQPVGPSLQSKALEKSAAPVYPPEAQKNRIQGTVRLSAIVTKDGTIRNLTFVGGPCVLADAAMTAVRQWRYKPTVVNGAPIEICTTIDVVFTLSR